MEEFVVPYVEETPPALSPREASSQAFYAAATSSENPMEDYAQAKADLELTGQSGFVEMATAAWEKEQDAAIRETVSSIITDSSIPTSDKKAILQTYALTGFIQPDLKEKYIQRAASRQVGPTAADKEAQDVVISTLEQRRAKQNIDETVEKAESLVDELLPPSFRKEMAQWFTAAGAATTDILVGIPAGIAKIYSLLKDRDVEKANALQAKVKEWAFDPNDKGAEEKRQIILQDLAKLGAIGEKAAEKEKAFLLKEGVASWKAELLAMKTSLLEDPFTYIGIGLVSKAVKKPLLEIPADSPASVTQMANPQAAVKGGANAIVDKTGTIAEAIGADRGTIVHDWVLPKPLPDVEQKIRPDLVAELKELDARARGVFQEYRYDPNLTDAARREEESTRLFNILQEQRSPYYQQSNSTIIETADTFEGTAIFGRNASSGYLREADAIAAQERLQESLNQLPEDLRGEVSLFKDGSEYYIKHEWKKDYSPLETLVFGPDSIQTSVLGMDVSGVARSGLGRWLFPTGWLPTWVEKGAARGIARTAVLEDKFLKEYRDKIASTPFGKEMTDLINEAEEAGKNYFSPAEISSKFPYLSKKQVDDLFETHVVWNRLQDYNYNFANRIHKNNLISEGMEGLFDENGNFIGPASKLVSETEKASIKTVWNFDSDNALAYTDQMKIRQDKTLLRLADPIRIGDEVIEYGLMGIKQKLGRLPTETLPRVPGYSPRKVRENFFVDVIPNELTINGYKVTDAQKLRNYSQTKAAARNEKEANALAAELQDMYPNSTISVRPERMDNFGQLITDYRVYNEMFKHSMKRGERLPSRDGPARLEDRLLTAIDTTKRLARLEAFSAWDQSFKRAYIQRYADFLPKKEFPQFKTDIKPLENMNRALKKEYDTAHRLYEYYANQKNFETLGDFLWKRLMWELADVLEKFRIPAALIRDIGRAGNPLMAARTAATTLFIHLNPIRQWIIQPIQMAELLAINPATGIKNLSLTGQVLMALGTDAKVVKRYNKILKYTVGAMAKTQEKAGILEKGEFDAIVEGVKQAGIIQSVDMNSVVHGVFKDVNRGFTETSWEAAMANTKQVAGVVPRLSRAAGFDIAEIANQVGTWLQTKDMWIAKNPGKDWKAKSAIEEISFEAWRLAGNMTRAGNLPYQQGALSILFQFAAIQQKLTMNILQDNATILTPVQRAKLGALRASMYGVKYGIPGGAIVYYLIDNEGDEATKEVMNQDVIRRGLVDYAVNGVIASIVEPDEKPDLAVSKMFSPYSEGFLPYLDFMHNTWLALEEDKVSNVKFPTVGLLSSFGRFIEDAQGWWKARDVNEDTYKMMFMEAAELASGMNSYAQGLLMLGMEDKVSRLGNKYDIAITRQEAYAKMFFGIPTQKEEDLWKLVKNERNKKKQLSEMAKGLHAQLVNQRLKIGEEGYTDFGRRLNSFISVLPSEEFNEMDKMTIMEEVVRLDRKSFVETRQSVFASIWQRYSEEMTNDRQMALDIMKRSKLPKAQETAKLLEEGKL